MLIDHITVVGRARKDLGNLDSLITSIQALGLLQPVGVKASGELIFGGRRLEAMRQLGFTSIPVRVLASTEDAVNVLRAELDENVEREPFTAVDAASLRRRMKELQLPTREEAQRELIAEHREETGRFGAVASSAAAASSATMDAQVSAATGFSVTTLQRVDRIAEFARAEDPAIAASAADALARIDMGAPVKPLLDGLINQQAVARATEKYPALENIRAESKHVVRMEAFLDDVAASGDADALQEELDAITALYGSTTVTSGPTSNQRELGFEINAALAGAFDKFTRSDGGTLLGLIAPSLTKAAAYSWLALAAEMVRVAALITSTIPDESDLQPS
jgi:ParB-like chromosome segregation protein Spo0J